MRSDELPDVRSVLFAKLNLSDHTFSVAWGPQPPPRGRGYDYELVGPWSDGLRRDLLASSSRNSIFEIVTGAQGPWANSMTFVDPEDWWIDPTHEGTLAYRIALPTLKLREARRTRIWRCRPGRYLEFVDPSEAGLEALRITWLCGLDKKTLARGDVRP